MLGKEAIGPACLIRTANIGDPLRRLLTAQQAPQPAAYPAIQRAEGPRPACETLCPQPPCRSQRSLWHRPSASPASRSSRVWTSPVHRKLITHRVCHSTVCFFASSCSPPHLTMTQLPSATGLVGRRGTDLHHPDKARSRTHGGGLAPAMTEWAASVSRPFRRLGSYAACVPDVHDPSAMQNPASGGHFRTASRRHSRRQGRACREGDGEDRAGAIGGRVHPVVPRPDGERQIDQREPGVANRHRMLEQQRD